MNLEILKNKRTMAIILVIALIFIGSALYLLTEDGMSIMDIFEMLSLGVITGNVELVKPDAYSYSGTATDWEKMDSTYGWGEFKSNEMGEVFFKNDNDPFTKADYADAHVAFKLKYMDVSGNNENAIVYLKIYQDSDPSSCLMSYKLELIDYDENSHWLIKTTGHDLSTFDTNNDGIINKASIYHSGNEDDWVRIYELQYIITFEEVVIDPCEGELCGDKCVGSTRYYNGECDPNTGECIYQTEANYVNCPDYNPCLGVTCDDDCIGEYWATGGECDPNTGDCIYDSKEKLDGYCGYTEPTPDPTGEPTPDPTGIPTLDGIATGTPTPTATEESLLDMIIPAKPTEVPEGEVPEGEVPEGEVPEGEVPGILEENIYLVAVIALIILGGTIYIISAGRMGNTT